MLQMDEYDKTNEENSIHVKEQRKEGSWKQLEKIVFWFVFFFSYYFGRIVKVQYSLVF